MPYTSWEFHFGKLILNFKMRTGKEVSVHFPLEFLAQFPILQLIVKCQGGQVLILMIFRSTQAESKSQRNLHNRLEKRTNHGMKEGHTAAK